jgi:hypothetical protein
MVNAAKSDVIIPEYEKTQVCSRDFFVDVTKELSGCLNKGATSWLLSTEAEIRRQKMLHKSATSKASNTEILLIKILRLRNSLSSHYSQDRTFSVPLDQSI